MNNILFHETQHFTSLIWGAVLAISFFIFLAIKRKRIPFFYVRGLLLLKVVLATLVACVLFLMLTIKLQTTYYPDRITYQFNSIFPGTPDTLYKDSIKNIQLLKTPIHHWGTSTDEANQLYTANGNTRLLITLLNGKTLQIGTQQPDSLLLHLKGYYHIEQ